MGKTRVSPSTFFPVVPLSRRVSSLQFSPDTTLKGRLSLLPSNHAKLYQQISQQSNPFNPITCRTIAATSCRFLTDQQFSPSKLYTRKPRRWWVGGYLDIICVTSSFFLHSCSFTQVVRLLGEYTLEVLLWTHSLSFISLGYTALLSQAVRSCGKMCNLLEQLSLVLLNGFRGGNSMAVHIYSRV